MSIHGYQFNDLFLMDVNKVIACLKVCTTPPYLKRIVSYEYKSQKSIDDYAKMEYQGRSDSYVVFIMSLCAL